MAETFPESVLICYPLDITSSWKTLITDMESGKEQRRKKWAFPLRAIPLNYKRVSPPDFRLVWKFYNERSGAYEAFWFFVPELDYWDGEYVGRGNGSQTIFDLPSKESASGSVQAYVDGVAASFTFVSGGGQGGSDRVTMGVAPATGTVVTADFYGKLRLNARFKLDALTKSAFNRLMLGGEVPIIQVKP